MSLPDTPTDEVIAAVKQRLAKAVKFCQEHPRDEDVKPDLADNEVRFWSAVLARLEELAAPGEATDVDLECAIGGAYEMPDGRKFWVDGPVAREIVRRIRALPKPPATP